MLDKQPCAEALT